MNPKEIGAVVANARRAREWSQEILAELAGGIGQSTIDRIEKGNFKRLPSHLPAICAVLDIPLPALGADERKPGAIVKLPRPTGLRDFKVYSAAEGGPGEIIVSSDPIDFLPRPEPVAHVKDAYGINITGESMWPEYRPGDTALVNPALPHLAGEVHIFYAEKEGEARASIKELKRATEREWQVAQHNPRRNFGLARKEWRWAHRVIGKFSRQ
jgi:transcriptional regulator with XRE-family HTH domain